MSIVANRPISQYRPPLRSRDLPLPPRWTPREKAVAQRRLTQFVVLSMVLHTIAIFLFGAPVGGSREGRAMWGSLKVVIREAYRPSPVSAPPVPPAPASSPRVEAPRPVTPAPPPPPPPPPEAQVTPPRPIDFPPLLDRLAPSEIKIDPAREFKVLPPETPKIPEPMLQPMQTLPERSTLPQFERVPTVRVPVETPKIPAPLLKPMPTLPERSALPPVDAAVIRVPVETPKIPAPLLQPMPTIQERATLPPVEMPVIRIPAETPPIPAPLLQPIAPLPQRSALPPVVETPAPPVEVAPRVAPVESRPPPAEIQRTPPVESRAPPAETRTPPPAETRTPPTEVPRTPAAETRSAPAEPPRTLPSETPSFKTPPPSRDPGSDYDPTKPTLDLDAVRRRAGEIARQGTGNRATLPFPMPPVEKPKSKMEQAIENARKPDCRDAWKGLGLLAALPLIANEFGEGNCRW